MQWIFFVGIALGIIFLLITIHEAAHFWVARYFNIQVKRFSLGFGPPLWCWQSPKTQIEYVIAWFPIGGYVRLLDTRESIVAPTDLACAFDQQSILVRASVLFSGTLANFILAIVLLTSALTMGLYQFKPIIGAVTPQSIASHAGLAPNDLILAVDDSPVISWQATLLAMFKRVGDHDVMHLKIQRHHQPIRIFTLDLKHWQLQPHDAGPIQSLGIKPFLPPHPRTLQDFPPQTLTWVQFPFFHAIKEAANQLKDFAEFNLIMLGKVLSGKLPLTSLGGPLSLLEGVYFAMEQGFAMVLSLAALLSVSLGVINLLPIPGLDGGQLFFLLIEAVTKRKIKLSTQVLFYRLGLILLGVLMIQVVINDLTRWLG